MRWPSASGCAGPGISATGAHRALDHYDVTEPLREEAIALGAVP